MASDTFYYTRLRHPQARSFYRQLRDAIRHGNLTGEYILNGVTDAGAARTDALDAAKALRQDRPDYFFLGIDKSSTRSGEQILLKQEILYTREEILRTNRILDQTLNRIAAEARQAGSTWGVEKAIYEWIANNIEYIDHEEANDHNVHGLLHRRSGVCEGYACLLCLAMRKAGIPCIRITGMTKQGWHCWNIVWIEGVPYHVDVTWDHPMNGQCSYRYFNLTDREISIDHTIPTEFPVPRCAISGKGYYAVAGLNFATEKEALRSLILAFWKGSRTVRFRLSCPGSVEQCIRRVIQKSPGTEYRFRCDEQFGTGIIQRSR